MYLYHVVDYSCRFYVLYVRFDFCCVVIVFLKYVFFSLYGVVLVAFEADVVDEMVVWFFLLVETHGA